MTFHGYLFLTINQESTVYNSNICLYCQKIMYLNVNMFNIRSYLVLPTCFFEQFLQVLPVPIQLPQQLFDCLLIPRGSTDLQFFLGLHAWAAICVVCWLLDLFLKLTQSWHACFVYFWWVFSVLHDIVDNFTNGARTIYSKGHVPMNLDVETVVCVCVCVCASFIVN